MRRAIPVPGTDEERWRRSVQGMQEANRVGLVRVHSAGGQRGIGDLQNVCDLYDELRRTGELIASILYRLSSRSAGSYAGGIAADRGGAPTNITTTGSRRRGEDHARWRGRDAHCRHARALYRRSDADRTTILGPGRNTSGSRRTRPRGLQIFTHAIGDRAIRLALDAYENAAESQSHQGCAPPHRAHRDHLAPLTFRASANLESLPAFSLCTPILTTTR